MVAAGALAARSLNTRPEGISYPLAKTVGKEGRTASVADPLVTPTEVMVPSEKDPWSHLVKGLDPWTLPTHPAIFTPENVRLLLSGNKTQTRRLANSPHYKNVRPLHRLWVREPFRLDGESAPVYFADESERSAAEHRRLRKIAGALPVGDRWRSSLHMPRSLSRVTLNVLGLRTQYLQEISNKDAAQEGMQFRSAVPRRWVVPGHPELWGATAKDAYARLWNVLHNRPGVRWEDNPRVTAVEFTVTRRNVDQRPARDELTWHASDGAWIPICRPAEPMTPQLMALFGTRWAHEAAAEIGDSDTSRLLKCPVCRMTWREELPQ
jgi:hypothetical protein